MTYARIATWTTAALMALLTSLPAAAQEQTFHGCYVPGVGAIYLIGLDGLPTECLAAEHVEISWREGQAGITDHGELEGLGDDDHPEYVREGEAAAGDLAGSFPAPMVAALRGRALAEAEPAEGQVLVWNAADGVWEPRTPAEGITDHGELAGLGDDDHPEYVREGDAAAGDLGGAFPEPSVAALQGNAVASTAPSDGEVLTWSDADAVWGPAAVPAGLTEAEVTAIIAETDHGVLAGLSDDDHPEYVREGEAAAGDLGGTFPTPAVAALQGNPVASTAPTDAQVLTWNATDGQWQPQVVPSGVTDHGDLAGLADDDHTQYALADGVRGTTNGFAVTGTYDVGSIPIEGAGTRVMWYPGKAAFRAGRVSGTEWDDVNVGAQSIALGTNVTASGTATTAIGVNASASGIWTTAIGIGATAHAPNGGAMALGGNTTASADGALAMGIGTEASGEGATAMGTNTVASTPYATAMGHETQASGTYATAMGSSTIAEGLYSTAFGNETTASGRGATAFGIGTSAYGDYSVAMGQGTVAGNGITAVGHYNVGAGGTRGAEMLIGGNGNHNGDRSNAFVFFKTGDAWIAGTLTESSDLRLKTRIEPLGPTLEVVRELTPVRFRFREGTGHPSDVQIGLIAQEVAEAFPELVSTDSEGYLSLAYPKLTAVLVRAIQEQQEVIEWQRGRLDAFTDRLERLEAAVERREPDGPQ